MHDRPYELISTPDGLTARIRVRGNDVLHIPIINRGTAFTGAERRALGLVGLLPTGVSSIEAQVRRTYGSTARNRTPWPSTCTSPASATATRSCSTGCWPSTSRR